MGDLRLAGLCAGSKTQRKKGQTKKKEKQTQEQTKERDTKWARTTGYYCTSTLQIFTTIATSRTTHINVLGTAKAFREKRGGHKAVLFFLVSGAYTCMVHHKIFTRFSKSTRQRNRLDCDAFESLASQLQRTCVVFVDEGGRSMESCTAFDVRIDCASSSFSLFLF